MEIKVIEHEEDTPDEVFITKSEECGDFVHILGLSTGRNIEKTMFNNYDFSTIFLDYDNKVIFIKDKKGNPIVRSYLTEEVNGRYMICDHIPPIFGNTRCHVNTNGIFGTVIAKMFTSYKDENLICYNDVKFDFTNLIKANKNIWKVTSIDINIDSTNIICVTFYTTDKEMHIENWKIVKGKEYDCDVLILQK